MLRITFFTLLASFLAFNNVEALPVRRGAGIITLPLKRFQPRGDVHPQILLQQHVNRGQRRFAQMTGTAGPSDDDFALTLHKRVSLIARDVPNVKRYNHGSVSPNDSQPLEIELGGEILETTGGNLANNSLGLDIFANDVGYFATLQMGTPPQDFKLLMDSGSADLWVGAENCQSEGGGCGNHNFLGAQTSSSFVDSNQPFHIVYGTGEVAGSVVTDTVNIAGLKLENHTFGVAKQETVDFSDSSIPFDGLMGLAHSTLSQQHTLTPVEALAKKGLIADAITSYKISRFADGQNDGEITFGGLDSTKFDSATLTTVDNVSNVGFWEANVDAVSVDGKDLGFRNRTAILDTGTTLILAPSADASALHAAIPGAKSDGQGGFTVPCTVNTTVALTFGSTSFSIDPRDLSLGPVNRRQPTGDCVSGISSSGATGSETQWLVGDVFLKNAYLSTNVGKNQISLAKLV